MNKTVDEAKTALDAARAALRSELESDLTRRDGSGAQERRREDHQQQLHDDVYDAKRELEQAQQRQRESASESPKE